MCNPQFDLIIKSHRIKSCFNFHNDLKVGMLGENLIETIFKNKNIKLEVKKDDWTVKTGNIAIEFECRGKPSGIQVTKADFWCHVIGHYFVLIFPVDFLKRVYESLCNDKKYVKIMGDKDGNGNGVSKAILIPWQELLKRFRFYQPYENN